MSTIYVLLAESFWNSDACAVLMVALGFAWFLGQCLASCVGPKK